jgi:hypothetical protein
LGEVSVVIQNTEKSGEKENSVGCKNIVCHAIPLFPADINQEYTIQSHAVEYNQQEEDAKVKGIPEAHDIQAETLLIETNNFIKHKACTPEPEDDLKGCNVGRALTEDSKE